MPAINAPALAAHLKRKRGEKTLREASDEIGIHNATLMQLEKGTTTPRLLTYVALCDWLGVDLDAFIESHPAPTTGSPTTDAPATDAPATDAAHPHNASGRAAVTEV